MTPPERALHSITDESGQGQLRIIAFLGLICLALVLTCLNFAYSARLSSQKVGSLVLIEILALFIFSFFAFKRHLRPFEPVVLFSAYYFTIAPVALYYLFTDFHTSIIANATTFKSSTDELLLMAMAYYVCGYVCMLTGYYSVRTARPMSVLLESAQEIPEGALNVCIAVFLAIGISNFAYNVYVISGGNLVDYLGNTAGREYEFEGKGLTTLGYHFAWVAAYVWFFKVMRRGRVTKSFAAAASIGFIMKVSTGRITLTLVFLGSFVVMYYFLTPEKLKGVGGKDRRYFLFLMCLAVAGVGFYFLRIFSALRYQGLLEVEAVEKHVSLENFAYLAIDRGNVPHIPIFMKILDSWGEDIGFLYGRSLVTWVLSLVPTGLVRPETYLTSLKIRDMWFSHLVGGGGLPPTGVGEMYANFGVLGPFIGMFIFGGVSAAIYNWLAITRSYWVLVVYSQLLLGFITIYPKTDFANLSPWYIVPIMMTAGALKVTGSVGRVLSRRLEISATDALKG